MNIQNFADDTTPFVCDRTLWNVLDKLERDSGLAIFWSENNYTKLNTGKRHLPVSGIKYENRAKIDNDKICESNKVKLLHVAIDNKLKFDSHIANICFKFNQKLSSLSRLAGLLTFDKKQILFKAFFNVNLSSDIWFGRFVAEEPMFELINYMNKRSDLYMIITKPHSRTFSQNTVYLRSIIQIFKRSYFNSIK